MKKLYSIPLITSLSMAAALLSGCATTKLTPQQCQAQNWQTVGLADGEKGRSPNYFGKYLGECAGLTGTQPNRQLWEQGRQEGLKAFCTELNAYRLGREGYQWQPVCPAETSIKLENAYLKGRNKYLSNRAYNYWDDYWFPSPYHHHYWHRHPYFW